MNRMNDLLLASHDQGYNALPVDVRTGQPEPTFEEKKRFANNLLELLRLNYQRYLGEPLQAMERVGGQMLGRRTDASMEDIQNALGLYAGPGIVKGMAGKPSKTFFSSFGAKNKKRGYKTKDGSEIILKEDFKPATPKAKEPWEITTKQASESPTGGSQILLKRIEYIPNETPEYLHRQAKEREIWNKYKQDTKNFSERGAREAAYSKGRDAGIKFDIEHSAFVKERERALEELGEKIPSHIEKVHYDSYPTNGIENYDTNNPDDIKKLLTKISKKQGFIGIRGIYKKEIGKKKLKPSNVWDDGKRTSIKLGGTSVIEIGEIEDLKTLDDLLRLINERMEDPDPMGRNITAKRYGDSDIYALVFTNETPSTEIIGDFGESVFKNAQVLGYINTPADIILPNPSRKAGAK